MSTAVPGCFYRYYFIEYKYLAWYIAITFVDRSLHAFPYLIMKSEHLQH